MTSSIETSKPWRNRVEIYGVKYGAILGGIYDNDGTFGVFGGGIEDEETSDAVKRELYEESGYTCYGVQRIPVKELLHEWHPPYASAEQAERAAKYRGSATTYYACRLGEFIAQPIEPSGLREVRLYKLEEAIKIQCAVLGTYPHHDRLLRRIACLAWLMTSLKQ